MTQKMAEKNRELLRLLASIPFENRRKLCLNVLPKDKKSPKTEGAYFPSSDTLVVQPDPILAKAVEKHIDAVWKHELDHVFHLRASIAGFMLKEKDLMAKRMFLTYLLYSEAERYGSIIDWIEKFETLRDGLFYDLSGVIEGSAIMLALEEENQTTAKDDKFYAQIEEYLSDDGNPNMQSYHLTNEIREKFGRDFVPHAIQIALNNAAYPIKSHTEIFQQIANVSLEKPSLLKSERKREELIACLLAELNLYNHPYKDVSRILRERYNAIRNNENEHYQGFISWYFLEGLRFWGQSLYSLKTLERIMPLKFGDEVSEEDKERYALDVPTYALIYDSPEKISHILANPLIKCPIHSFYYNFDNFMAFLLSEYKTALECSPVNIDGFRKMFASFLDDQKRSFEEKFTESDARAFLNIFPQLN